MIVVFFMDHLPKDENIGYYTGIEHKIDNQFISDKHCRNYTC